MPSLQAAAKFIPSIGRSATSTSFNLIASDDDAANAHRRRVIRLLPVRSGCPHPRRAVARTRSEPPVIDNLTLAGAAFRWLHASSCPPPHANACRRPASQDHVRRDARDGLARRPDLLRAPVRLSALCLPAVRATGRRSPARFRSGQGADCSDGVPKHEMTKGWGRPFEEPIEVAGRKIRSPRPKSERPARAT